MKFQETIAYTYAIQELLPVLTDPAFLLRKYVAQGASNIKPISRDISEQKSSICIQRDVPVSIEIPAFARSMVPSCITLVQTDTWNKVNHTGQLKIEFKGMPVKVGCQMKMINTEEGAFQTLDFDIRVNVPLIGGKLEDLLARDIRHKFMNDTLVTKRIISTILNGTEKTP